MKEIDSLSGTLYSVYIKGSDVPVCVCVSSGIDISDVFYYIENDMSFGSNIDNVRKVSTIPCNVLISSEGLRK